MHVNLEVPQTVEPFTPMAVLRRVARSSSSEQTLKKKRSSFAFVVRRALWGGLFVYLVVVAIRLGA
jgi:hypothetical protein